MYIYISLCYLGHCIVRNGVYFELPPFRISPGVMHLASAKVQPTSATLLNMFGLDSVRYEEPVETSQSFSNVMLTGSSRSSMNQLKSKNVTCISWQFQPWFPLFSVEQLVPRNLAPWAQPIPRKNMATCPMTTISRTDVPEEAGAPER